jgi:hypothetical protein
MTIVKVNELNVPQTIQLSMSDILDQALASHTSTVPDLRMGQKVVELGGDGSILVIAEFRSTSRGQWDARCFKLRTDEIVTLPVSAIKPAEQPTIN